MIEKKEIEKLAQLARIEVSDEEKEKLQKDIGAILDYVSEINEVVAQNVKKEVGELYNVMREDDNPHESGVFSEKILEQAPEREKGYFKVKKIL